MTASARDNPYCPAELDGERVDQLRDELYAAVCESGARVVICRCIDVLRAAVGRSPR